MKSALAFIAALVAGFVAWVAAQFVLSTLSLPRPGDGPLVTLYVLSCLGAAVAATWGTLKTLRRRGAYTPLTLVPWAKRVLVGAYLLTWAFGAPAAQSEVTRFAIDEYKRMQASRPDEVFPSHPWINFTAAIPIAPCVVVTYHEYQLAGLYGFGGWGLHIWYGFGARQVFGLPVWLS